METKRVKITKNRNIYRTAVSNLLGELGVVCTMWGSEIAPDGVPEETITTVMTQQQIDMFRLRGGNHKIEVDEPEKPVEAAAASASPVDQLQMKMAELQTRIEYLESIVGDLLATNAKPRKEKSIRQAEQQEPVPA